MNDNNKIKIGQYEYTLCIDEKEKIYLYRYDIDYRIGIKIKFSDEYNDSKNTLKDMLKKQFIDDFFMNKN